MSTCLPFTRKIWGLGLVKEEDDEEVVVVVVVLVVVMTVLVVVMVLVVVVVVEVAAGGVELEGGALPGMSLSVPAPVWRRTSATSAALVFFQRFQRLKRVLYIFGLGFVSKGVATDGWHWMNTHVAKN